MTKAVRAILQALSYGNIEVESARRLADLKKLDPMRIFLKKLDTEIYNGSYKVPVRLYFPDEKAAVSERAPVSGNGAVSEEENWDPGVILFFHGGGWTTESVETYDRVCSRMAQSTLMPILQKAQDIYGYLPIEVQKMISDETGIPMEKIYGVATFYSQFTLSPKGKYRISVCLGTACYVKGSGDIYNALMEKLGIVGGECTPDGRFSLDACRCVGACGLAPVMMINDEVYGRLTVDDLDDILAKYE